MPEPTRAEPVSWDEFNDRFVWNQGEHLTAIGHTGSGKTTLINRLLHRREFVVVFGTKPKDETLEELIAAGYRRIGTWNPKAGNRLILWPPVQQELSLRDLFRKKRPDLSDEMLRIMARQKKEFGAAMATAFFSGGWTVVNDEVAYESDFLGLEKQLRMLWQTSRAGATTVVAATQRPAFIPLAAYSQATHLFFWQDNDEANLKRIGGLGGLAAGPIRQEVAGLARHEVLYLNKITGERLRFTPEVQ